MSFADNGAGGGSGAMPSWATRANEPLVPAVHIPTLKKAVLRDLKEIQKASDEISKLRKRGSRDVNPRLVTLSAQTRERARETSRTLRQAFGEVAEGSADHATLKALFEDFSAKLRTFQQEAEAAAPSAPAAPAGCSGSADAGRTHALDIEGARHGGDAPAAGSGQAVAELQAVAFNEDLIAEREQSINQLNRTVQEVAEIYQDLALLVNEQGEHIDNIQSNIENAANQTHRGVRELAKANRSQKRARSRMCCMAVLCIVLLIVLIIVLRFAMNLKFR